MTTKRSIAWRSVFAVLLLRELCRYTEHRQEVATCYFLGFIVGKGRLYGVLLSTRGSCHMLILWIAVAKHPTLD